ncbi:MAG: hypothetical protein K2G93_05935 [Rikenella sp.]|nr:hypothetical protein [Rikenella sp.]
MTNDRFSWKRFGLFARAEMAGQGRKTLFKAIGFALTCAMVYSLWNIDAIFHTGHRIFAVNLAAARGIVFLCFAFIVSLNLSRSFKRYFSKGEAVASFMTPVARSEKFLYAALKNMVVVPLGLLTIMWLNDLFWTTMLGRDDFFGMLFDAIVKYMDIRLALFLLFVLLKGFCVLAFFLAGAVLFRRHQYLGTLIAFFVLNIPFFVLVQIEPGALLQTELAMDSTLGLAILDLIVLGFGSLFLFLAWRRFSTLPIPQ